MNRLTAISLFAAGSLAISAVGCSDAPLSATNDSPAPHETINGNEAKLIAAAPGAELIPDSYIVVLRDDVARENGLQKSVASVGGQYADVEIVGTFSHSFSGFSARIPEARLQSLLADRRVAYIEQDQVIQLCSTSTVQTMCWGGDYVGADSSSTRSNNGSGSVSGVDVYVIDTGIDVNHDDLNVVGGINYGNPSRDTTYYTDEFGHGTHVAGIIGAYDNSAWTVGVAPGVPLYSVRVFGPTGGGSMTTLLRGIDWVKKHSAARSTPAVVNMSLSSSSSLTLDRAVKGLITAGMTVCVAAGNDASLASTRSPARLTEAITVAACSSNGYLAQFSNYGSCVDMIAPGVGILSSQKGGGVRLMNGTSMATPHVAGAAALYLSLTGNSTKTPAQVDAALDSYALGWGVSLPTGTANKVLRVTRM